MQGLFRPVRALAGLLGLVALLAGFTVAGYAQGTNLLKNPGFEGTYATFAQDNNRIVAPEWTPWNVPPPGDPSYVNNVPNYRESTTRFHSGTKSQEYYTFYATLTGGLYQQAKVNDNAKVKFSAWIYVWSTLNDNTERSDNPGKVSIQVGVAPTGGTDGTANNIIWSEAVEYYDQWKEITVETTALSDTVTVFVRATFEQPVKHNNVYVDDATLTSEGGQPPVTATAIPPTSTTVPPTSTALPASSTAFPPTETAIPPTATTLPASSTPRPPTSTALPPSATTNPNVRPSPTREGTIVATPIDGATSIPPVTVIPTTALPSGPTPTPFSETFPFTIRYTVVAGDTVSELAQRFNSTVEAITTANDLNDAGLIFIGQSLDIPSPTAAAPTIAAPTAAPLPTQAPAFPTVQPPASSGLNGPTVNGIGTYIVVPGDDLAKIAALYRTTPAALARLNGIVNANLLRVGQVLVVPGPGNNTGGRAPVITQPQRTHTVLIGQTLYRISLLYGVTVDALVRANNLANPNLIYVGQVLRIP